MSHVNNFHVAMSNSEKWLCCRVNLRGRHPLYSTSVQFHGSPHPNNVIYTNILCMCMFVMLSIFSLHGL